MSETITNERLLETLIELLQVTREIREFVPRTVKPRSDPPQHADMGWVMEYLEISESTFYRNVRNQLLFPIRRIGSREYYDRQEVYDLLRRVKETRRTVGYLRKNQEKEASASFFVPTAWHGNVLVETPWGWCNSIVYWFGNAPYWC